MRLPSRSRQAAARAVKIWAVTAEDRKMVETLWGHEAETMIETGSTPDPEAKPRELKHGEVLQLMWCGIIEDRKGLPLLLRALASLDASPAPVLNVVGDGPDRARCEKLGESLGLGDRVVWHGRIEHRLVRDRMAGSHLFVHTAIKEGTPHVVLEALAAGLPVLCHDACGMGTAVTDACGIKIPLESPANSVRYLSASLRELTEDSYRLHKLSDGALSRSKELTWERLGNHIGDTYEKHLFKA
jgi:glycosyltransferase involved in cell wall biosynthesis